MSKYIDLGKVKELVFNADISMAETEALYKSLDNLPTIEVSEDCISKAWLKTELDKWSLEEGRKDAWDNWNKAIDTLIEIIDDAPSVVPQTDECEGCKHYVYQLGCTHHATCEYEPKVEE